MKYTVIFMVSIMLFSCSKKVTNAGYVDQPKKKEVALVLPETKKEEPKKETVETKTEKTVTVYFKFDSDVLQKGEIWKISNLTDPVELTGGACPIGMDYYNYTLGMKRAIAVRDYLEKNGVVVKSMKSVGENNLIETDRDKYHFNRRCEVKY